MAVIISEKEAAQVLTSLGHLFDALCSQRRNIGKYAAQLEAQGNTAATVATAINAMLADWDSLRDQFVTELSAVPTTYQSVVRIGMPAMYNSANIEATNQSNTNDLSQACGIIRADSICEMNLISPFSVFASGDVVSISNAEDSSNNLSAEVQRTPATAGAEQISNGGFASATGWTETGDSGTEVVITGGQAVFTAATATLAQAKADMSGGGWTNSVVYLVTFTLSSVSGGTLAVGTNTNPSQHTVTANGTHRALITADNNAVGLIFTATGFTGNMDSVSAIAFTGLSFNTPLGTDNAADTKLVITLQER